MDIEEEATGKAAVKKEKYVPALSFGSLTFLYDPIVRWTTREKEFKTRLVDQADVKAGQKILDVGCGTATLAIALKKRCTAAIVHGLDGDPKILAIARRKTQRENIKVFLEQGISYSLPYENASFDCVVSSLFFHHLTPENKKNTLREIWRVMKPKGSLHIADWGKPDGRLMVLASKPVEWLDGPTVKDSFQGLLASYLTETGFDEVAETARFNTFFGTTQLLRAKK